MFSLIIITIINYWILRVLKKKYQREVYSLFLNQYSELTQVIEIFFPIFDYSNIDDLQKKKDKLICNIIILN